MGRPDSPIVRTTRVPASRAAWLARRVAAWRDGLTRPSDAPVDELRPLLTRFCQSMHRAGARGPQVRRLAGAVVRDALDGRVADHERERAARAAQGVVDVIYLTGAHRTR